VQLDGHVDVYVSDRGNLTERLLVEKFDRDGNVVEILEGDAAERDVDAKWTPDFAFVPHYKFADWPGSEEVPDLCKRYLERLQALVADGRLRGMLSAPEHAA
jgi:hypothetical protein